jgi:hypothetical protein
MDERGAKGPENKNKKRKEMKEISGYGYEQNPTVSHIPPPRRRRVRCLHSSTVRVKLATPYLSLQARTNETKTQTKTRLRGSRCPVHICQCVQ